MSLYGIIGYPLGHSLSHEFFTEKFIKEGLTGYRYCKFELPDITLLPALLKSEPSLCGFNVTIPWKVKVMDYLDEIDPVAAETGAVNTVRISRHDGSVKLKGYNTDAPAFRESLLTHLDALPSSALVLGTGGAAKSVVYVLRHLKIKTIPVSRGAVEGGYDYHSLPCSLVAAAGLIVNTTPLGMAPATDSMPPLDYSCLKGGTILFDLIYNPAVTLFLKEGAAHRCHTVNGKEMFVKQAEMAWKIWNEQE